MNWEAVSGIAEIFGASGVIGSLLYVGYQIRQNTIAAQRTNARHTAAELGNSLGLLIDEQVAEIFLRGSESLENLNTVERYRFDLAMVRWLQAIEQAFLDHREGFYPDEQFNTYRNNIPAVLNTPGGSDWWHQRDAWFCKSFRDDVNKLLFEPGDEASKAGVKPG